MIRETHPIATVGIVDEDAFCYAGLVPLGARVGLELRFYGTGRDVLRRRGRDRHAFWLISLELPDMTGFDLFEMLRDRLDGAPVCLVGRIHRPDDELRTYRAGAAMYICKPLEPFWLCRCLRRVAENVEPRRSRESEISRDTARSFTQNVSFVPH